MRHITAENVCQTLALALTGVLGWAVVASHTDLKRKEALEQPAIQIELARQNPPPVPAAVRPDPPSPPQRPRAHARREVPDHHPMPPEATPLMAETTAALPPNEVPMASDEAAPSVPPPRQSTGTLEAQYAETLRTNIDARTVAPGSAEYRLRHPRGETLIAFTLDRQGSLLTANISRTSGSEMLDRQAVSIVRAGHYPAFPDAAFRGEARHSFTVTLEFNL